MDGQTAGRQTADRDRDRDKDGDIFDIGFGFYAKSCVGCTRGESRFEAP